MTAIYKVIIPQESRTSATVTKRKMVRELKITKVGTLSVSKNQNQIFFKKQASETQWQVMDVEKHLTDLPMDHASQQGVMSKKYNIIEYYYIVLHPRCFEYKCFYKIYWEDVLEAS